MQLTVLPLLAKRMETEFDVFEELENTLEKNKTKLEDGDVIVISKASKTSNSFSILFASSGNTDNCTLFYRFYFFFIVL